MKKKIIAILLLSMVFAGSVFAQEEEMAKNRIALSLGIVIGDLSYERVLTPHLSVLGQVSYNNFLLIADSLSVAAKGRWYPFGGVFFLDLGLGYSYGYNSDQVLNDAAYVLLDIPLLIITLGLYALTPEFQSHSYSGGGVEGTGGFFIQPGLGWNIDIGKKDWFRLPIAMGLDIRLAEINTVIPNFKIGVSYAF